MSPGPAELLPSPVIMSGDKLHIQYGYNTVIKYLWCAQKVTVSLIYRTVP